MNYRISGLRKVGNDFKSVDMFGYSTNGVPGLEVIGLGNYSRNIKEKFIFLTRQRKLQIPLKRYILCVEKNDQLSRKNIDCYTWLELPLLLLFWSLAGEIPIHKLDDCVAMGQVSVKGKIVCPQLNEHEVIALGDFGENGLKIIGPEFWNLPKGVCHLPLENIFTENINFKISSYMDKA